MTCACQGRFFHINDYNLNIPRYIDSSEPEDLHDLDAHLNGGIPERDIDALQDYWQVFPTLRQSLFEPLRRGYEQATVESAQVKPTILDHPEFAAFRERILERFHAWRDPRRAQLHGLNNDTEPKALIKDLAEALLDRFDGAPLIDPYAIYQHLMDYWGEAMQDDVYAIIQDGWLQAAKPRELVAEKGKKQKETPDLTICRKKYKTDLIPPDLIVARYLAAAQARIDQLQAEADAAAQELEGFIEEQSGEEGPLEEAKNDKGKITRASLKGPADRDQGRTRVRR